MRLTLHFVITLFLGVVACQPLSEPTQATIVPMSTDSTVVDSTVLYYIKRGDHYCQQSRQLLTMKSTLIFKATFNESAIYRTVDPAKQNDVNKLYGFSDCGTPHQTNSARFGWTWQDEALTIYAYHYYQGELRFHPIGVAQLNQPYQYQIRIEANKYVFSFDGKEYTTNRGCSDTGQLERYMLYPYFGGLEVAPHDITIAIQEL